MTEDELKQIIRAHFGLRRDVKLFTNPVGNGWVASNVRQTAGGMFLEHPRRQIYGLCPGSSDLIGWLEVEVLGVKICVFIAFEVKTTKGRPTDEQLNFIARVTDAGGIAGIVRSVEDCEALISDFKTKLKLGGSAA